MIHLIDNLKNGGAENVLAYLCLELNKQKAYEQTILTIRSSENDFNFRKVQNEIEVINFQENHKKCLSKLKKDPQRPVILWMYKSIIHFHFLKLVYSLRNPIYWNIRNSDFHFLDFGKKLGLYGFGLISHFSKVNIIYCSQKSFLTHKNFFFNNTHSKVIINRLAKKSSNNIIKRKLNKPYILFVGRFHKQKGPRQLKKIIEELLTQNLKLYFILIGKGWKKNFFKSEIQNRVIIKYDVSDIYAFYQSTLCLVYTSQYGEGYPNVVAEAMSVGTPIVGFDCGDYKSMIKIFPFADVANSKEDFFKLLNEKINLQPSNEKKAEIISLMEKELNFTKTVNEYYNFIIENN